MTKQSTDIIKFKSPQLGVFKKLLSISHFFSFKKWLKSGIFDESLSGGNKRRYYKKFNAILIGKTLSLKKERN